MGPKKKGGASKKAKQEKRKNLLLAKQEAEALHLQRLARLEEIKKLEEDAEEREKLQAEEHSARLAMLESDYEVFESKKSEFIADKIKKRELAEWSQYLRCDRLPDPNMPQSMNTHLYFWSNLKEFPSMELVLESIEKFIRLLSETEKLIEDPLDASARTIENWKEVRQSYRREILKKLDQGTFAIVREIQTKANRIDYWTVDYKCSSENIKICMWAWLDFPISDLTQRDPPLVDFPEVGVTVKLPVPYDRKFVLVRVIHILFDPLSDSSKSWDEPSSPVEQPLIELVDVWHKKKIELDKYNWAQEVKELEQEKLRLTVTPDAKGGKKDAKDKDKKNAKDRKGGKSKKDKKGDKSKKGNKGGAEDAEEKKKKVSIQIEEVIVRPYIEREKGTPRMSEEHRQYYLNNVSSDLDDEFLMKLYCDIRETVLSVMCGEDMTAVDKTISVSIRSLVEKGDPDQVKLGLLSLQLSESTFKAYLFNYFRKVPQFFERIPEEVIEMLPITLIETREEATRSIMQNCMNTTTVPEEINLRKFSVLGGIYYLDLIEQVDQKFPLEDGNFVQIHYGDYEINKDEFCFFYEPPQVLETDESEEEKPPPDDNIDKLIYIEISLPENIVWFETPTPVLWDSDRNFWTTEYIYDTKFNEEKQRLCFRIGRTLPIGLCVVRYNNLPFQTWELRPGPADSNTVHFSLTASTVIIELIINGDKLALESLQNATNAALEPILGKFYEPNELINIMKRAGLDVFPEEDAFLYIEGNSYKDNVVEDLVYKGMAMFAPFFQFCWSRWNMLAGWDTLVYQVRQAYNRRQLPNYCMVMSNLFRTTIVECSEVSPSFTDESIANIEFSPDLYSLLRNVCSSKIKPLIDNVETNLIYTVYQVLKKTKVFSYS